MSSSDDLVRRLAADLEPVRPLRPPVIRGMMWAAWTIAVLVGVGFVNGVRDDLASRLQDVDFIVPLLAALITGIAAALAALVMSLPDRHPTIALLPVPPFILWASSVGYGCITNWVAIGEGDLSLGVAANCFAIVAGTSIPLALVSAIMLRHAARLRPRRVALLGALAVTGVASFALSLFHPLEASAMILIWNIGMAGILGSLASTYGRILLSWRGLSQLGGQTR